MAGQDRLFASLGDSLIATSGPTSFSPMRFTSRADTAYLCEARESLDILVTVLEPEAPVDA